VTSEKFLFVLVLAAEVSIMRTRTRRRTISFEKLRQGGFLTRHPLLLLYSPRMENPDQLRELFRMQKALNERIGVKTDGMSEEEKTKWLLNYTRAMQQEMAELTDSVPWKWWAKYQKFDEQNARVEVVDLFHFLISMAQVLGMSADDVFAAYIKKNEVNFKRQDSGYATKDHEDSKHI
jgi:dimeric dUTPase (all-alpha-NTP-PPase superfamily)